jgi:hypothetical protein
MLTAYCREHANVVHNRSTWWTGNPFPPLWPSRGPGRFAGSATADLTADTASIEANSPIASTFMLRGSSPAETANMMSPSLMV